MTTKEEVIEFLSAAGPEDLRDTFATLATVFARRAEALYDKNPEDNGVIAQPYADLADTMSDASMVFEEQAPSLVDDEPAAEQLPLTVSAAVARNATAGSPWGKR